MTPEISIVIPVCSEGESLPELFAQVDAAMAKVGKVYEVILVDDGSKDDSWKIIQTQSKNHPHYRGIRFRRNFGKAAALAAGFKASHGQIIFTLDADLQDDPAEIPNFLTKLDEGYDVISGWKKIRHDPWHKVFPSRVFNGMVSRVTGTKLHDHNCGFKCYRVDVLRDVRLYGELHRFVPVLAAARGYRVGELVIQHRARKFGKSHYGVKRFIKGFLDLVSVRFLTAFGHRPQHVLGSVGLFAGFVGGLGLLAVFISWIMNQFNAANGFGPMTTILLAIFSAGTLLGGTMTFLAGLLAELIVERSSSTSSTSSISETTDPPTQ